MLQACFVFGDETQNSSMMSKRLLGPVFQLQNLKCFVNVSMHCLTLMFCVCKDNIVYYLCSIHLTLYIFIHTDFDNFVTAK